MKKNIFIALIICASFLGGYSKIEAVTVEDSYAYNPAKREGPFYYWGDSGGIKISGYTKFFFSKTFNLVRANNAIANSNFTLNIDEVVRLDTRDTKGEGKSLIGIFKGHSWPFDDYSFTSKVRSFFMDNTEYLYYTGDRKVNDYSSAYFKIKIEDSGQPILTSSNSDIIKCEGLNCKAIKGGEANITVSFPKESYTNKITTTYKLGKILGNSNAYGKAIIEDKFYFDFSTGRKLITKNIYWQTYSFNPYVYTVTVPSEPKKPHVVTCSGVQQADENSGKISWTYQDDDNDKQTNYQIEISEQSDFSTPSKYILAPANTDISNIREALITGPAAGKTYYARVRAHADNSWSSYSVCPGNFTTAVTPQVSDLQVSCSAPGIQPGGTATFTATALGNSGSVTYDWLEQENGVPVKSGSSNTYSKSYSNIGSYKVWIRASDSVKSVNNFCSVTVGCDGSYFEGETTACDLNTRTQDVYSCTSSGWTTTSVPCGGGGDDPTATFSFDPWIVRDSSEKCGLTLEATNVSSCSLIPTSGGSYSPILADKNNKINLTRDRRVSVGKHTLSCIGTDLITEETFGTKSCILNPEVREF